MDTTCSIVKSCNSTTAALVVPQALSNVGKSTSWGDVIGLSSNSAAYMCISFTQILSVPTIHFNDIAHLIHVAVDAALPQ